MSKFYLTSRQTHWDRIGIDSFGPELFTEKIGLVVCSDRADLNHGHELFDEIDKIEETARDKPSLRHYTINKRPPAHWPMKYPLAHYDHVICFPDGTVWRVLYLKEPTTILQGFRGHYSLATPAAHEIMLADRRVESIVRSMCRLE